MKGKQDRQLTISWMLPDRIQRNSTSLFRSFSQNVVIAFLRIPENALPLTFKRELKLYLQVQTSIRLLSTVVQIHAALFLALWIELIPSVRPSLNFFLFSHLLRDHWSDWFRNLSEMFHSSGLVVSSHCINVWDGKWSWSVNKYGRTAAIFKRWIALYFTLWQYRHRISSETTDRIFYFN